MKGLALCPKGIEDISVLEIKELIGKEGEVIDSGVIFEVENYNELCKLCYYGQSFEKVILLEREFKFDSIEDIKYKIKDIKFPEFIKNKTFKVDVESKNPEFTYDILAKEIGKVISETQKIIAEIRNPDVVIFVYIVDNICYIGIDFSVIELKKRDYRIFVSATSTRSTIAYALVRLSGYNTKETFLDPYCNDGTISIEAAHFAVGKPVNFFIKDKFGFNNFLKYDFPEKKLNEKVKIYAYDSLMRNINAAKKNAKIADINDFMQFGRGDPDWLETKFDEKSIDCVATRIPYSHEDKQRKKYYDELFWQMEYLMAKDGKIAVLIKDTELLTSEATKHKFTLSHKREVFMGKEPWKIAIFEIG